MITNQMSPEMVCRACWRVIEGDYTMVRHGFKPDDKQANYDLCEPCAKQIAEELRLRGQAAYNVRSRSEREAEFKEIANR